MNINSMIFLTVFLPVIFAADRLCARKTALKNILLMLASLAFYAWGEPVYILLLLVSIAINYGIGLILGRMGQGSAGARVTLAAGVAANLLILGYYKYFDFFLRILNRLTGSEFEMRNIPLPIGISFFTFGAIAYLADLYRGHYRAEVNPVNMALYLSFFPKMSVGPIARYQDFGPQLRQRKETVEKTAEGIRRFCYGLAKKMLIANIVGASVDKIYAQDIGNVTGAMVWCAALLYTLQIYYDFSGFSDMAIGLGKMFGFDICENFNYPYLSGSVQEFWRRWHISLSSWFRDYLYIPLGGNRKGRVRTYVNLGIVFLATGLWHGATTAFVAWGAMHGFFMILERVGFKKVLDRIGVLRYAYTGLVVVFGWVIFRVANLRPALQYLQRMLAPWRYTESTYALRELVSNRCIVTAVAGVLAMGIVQAAIKRFCPAAQRLKGGIAELVWCMLLLGASILLLVNGTYSPAIYLNF
ncbi:MAG: MBOAT family protein [Eubacteriales bacterium]|nr:MBOAT family protein [Eubacteriales bacterium]